MKTFLFYDVETSGLNPAFDQILTFAAIRTGTDLQELDRTELTIRLRQDIVPSPHAFITHCLTQDALSDGIVEYQAAMTLHRLFNTPDTISIGYNSLGFDDEFIRFLFYRNLLDPYSHQYANGCSRADLLPVAALYRIFAEDVIQWPSVEDGKPSLKLDLISQENAFITSGRAHEAMSDVEALVALCRRFADKPDIWAYAQGFFDKHTDLARQNAFDKRCRIGDHDFTMGLMISPSFGARVNYLAPVLHIGNSIPYKNQGLWVRLDQEGMMAGDGDDDTSEASDVSDASDTFDWYVIRKKPGDQYVVLPCLDRFLSRLDAASRAMAKANLTKAQADPGPFLDTVRELLEYRYPDVPDIDPDADLYQSGFFSVTEKKEMTEFHDAADKADVLGVLASPRIKRLAVRIVARNFDGPPDAEFDDHLDRLVSGKEDVKGFRGDAKYNLGQAMAAVSEIETEEGVLDSRQRQALDWVKTYLSGLSSKAS